jgi:hypothetical protein
LAKIVSTLEEELKLFLLALIVVVLGFSAFVSLVLNGLVIAFMDFLLLIVNVVGWMRLDILLLH